MFEKMVKMRNKKGFTLMELLIVVAIIAILVAVSIPVFTSQLEKAREETDIANMRAAKGVAVSTYLAGDTSLTAINSTTAGVEAGKRFAAYYDAVGGKLVKDAPTAKYGKGTSTDGGGKYDGYDATKNYTSSVIKVDVTDAGVCSSSKNVSKRSPKRLAPWST